MRLLFSIENQVHLFKATGDIAPADLTVFRKSLLRFLDGLPSHTIIDLSETSLHIPDSDLQKVLLEIQTLAKAKGLNLVVAQTDIESRMARQTLLETVLQKRIEILKGKLALREEMKTRMEALSTENLRLQQALGRTREELRAGSPSSGPFSPLLEKLWGEP